MSEVHRKKRSSCSDEDESSRSSSSDSKHTATKRKSSLNKTKSHSKKRTSSDLKSTEKSMIRSSSHNNLDKALLSDKKLMSKHSRRTVSDISLSNSTDEITNDLNVPNSLIKNAVSDSVKSTSHKSSRQTSVNEGKSKTESSSVRKNVTQKTKSKRLISKSKKRKASSLHDFLNGVEKENDQQNPVKQSIFNQSMFRRKSEDDIESLRTPVAGFLDFQLPIIDIHKDLEMESEISEKFSFPCILEKLHRTLAL
ncbi:hypothetical protein TVAG_242950 [Trichomonas vaginalis G3]|uniref:Uncharacterized protein n=1 Tax=Trichomonas vaginalis (strain ATCC PRA-98 / G3) TaxID=412133 RepID=A2F854_TRIV3|nr:hypothetical protein TVAGG3_0282980 [Trichomonas vaginalis G3]EAX98930.1 hypothetical protein TVAG_242950 [Trichomonas vaginalis G3]KAI5526693.1 hypothetical protein TVAGG3_0282980 [Trichomonas vaginalis G3]|eukprot:XP_001311860.1 hypothetical protein [Trichomonas vaginalis G3]